MQKALFLDRDGVINVEKDYLYKIEDFEFIDGIFELCNHYQNLGYLVIVVTNQSGIAREYYTEDDFDKLTSWMLSEFSKRNIYIKKVYYCPHHPDISGDCSCRKPKAGMLINAKEEFGIDLKSSILIGDKDRDIQAGINAGLRETYLYDEDGLVVNSDATRIVSKLEEVYSVNT